MRKTQTVDGALRHPAVLLVLLAIATGLALLAFRQGNIVVMCITGTALAGVEIAMVLLRPARGAVNQDPDGSRCRLRVADNQEGPGRS
jgi:hypothetical protein